MEFNTTLLRERFVISDLTQEERAEQETVIALSNRLVVPLMNRQGDIVETFVIRSRIMHTAVRMAAQILMSYQHSGPLMARSESFDFETVHARICESHDLKYNDEPWVCVYKDAKLVYKAGNPHSFLGIIEKCDLKNPGNYDQAVVIAEETFKKMGRKVSISHSSNIGMVAHIKSHSGRCGMIIRSPHKSTTFNYVAEKKDDEFDVTPYACLNACAAFLEGIQLSVRIGMIKELMKQGQVGTNAIEVQESHSSRARLSDLLVEIEGFENQLDVRYRPEKAVFSNIIKEAELFQRDLLKSEM